MTFLADTNIVSELTKRTPNPGALAWADAQARIALSVITLEEIAYGLGLRPNARRTTWWDSLRRAHVDALDVTPEIADVAGAMRARQATLGRVRSQADMLIAATAHVRRLTLVTHNTRDFEGCGVTLLDPFA